MTKFMTEETPGKVFSLLGAALFSMAFLFAVTVSDASFTQVQSPLPDPLAMLNVMPTIDTVANSYSNIVYAYVITPVSQDVAFVGDNVNFIADNAGPQLASIVGLDKAVAAAQPQVAGASTEMVFNKYYPTPQGVFSIFYR